MDFSFNEEQRLLTQSVEHFLETEYPIEFRREVVAGSAGYSPEIWSKLAELGFLGISVPEKYGGIGATSVETAVVMGAIGRSLVVEPFLATAVIGARILVLGANEAQKAAWLPQLAAGSLQLSLAYVERQARFDLANIETRAEPSGSGYMLNGEKSIVLNGATADKIFVVARSSGDPTDHSGLSLFIVDREAKGMVVQSYPMIDGLRGVTLRLENVAVEADRLIGQDGEAFELVERVIDEATVAVCAEAVGIMETLQRLTLDYLRERRQFGQPLSGFQALQHRLVDMMIACELSRSLAYMAAVKVDCENVAERRRAVSAAKIQIGKAGRLVGQESIQLHGGMGMADETGIGHYFKRLTAITTLFGDINHHKARFAY